MTPTKKAPESNRCRFAPFERCELAVGHDGPHELDGYVWDDEVSQFEEAVRHYRPSDADGSQPQMEYLAARRRLLARTAAPPSLDAPAEIRRDFTNAELYAISLCVGWILPLSESDSPDAQWRRKYGNEALEAFRRVIGEGFHTTLQHAAERDAVSDV